MKSVKLMLTKAALLSCAGAFAASIDSRVSDLEKKMKEVRTETTFGTAGGLTASARAEVEGSGWSILFGPTFQHVRVGGTEFCYTEDSLLGDLPLNGRTKDIDFEWDWGIHAALGYNFEHDLWDIQLEYNWLSSSGQRSVTAGRNNSLVALKGYAGIVQNCVNFGSSAIFAVAKIAKSTFEFDLNTLILDLGRDYFVSQYLALRPHFGIRTDWLMLQQKVRYSGGDATGGISAPLLVNTVAVKDKSDFWGLGTLAGLDSNWYLGSGFSIFGNIAGALLFGRFDVDHKEKFSLCSNSNRINLDANKHGFVPVAQFQLGLSYERYFDDHKQHIGLRIGYETQYFWRANQMIDIDDYRSFRYERYSEDVALRGLMIDAKWTF